MVTIIGLILVGTLLVFLETCVIGGVLGVIGAGCFCWAIWEAYELFGIIGGGLAAGVSLVASLSAFFFWIYFIPKTSFGKKFYLTSAESGKSPAPNFESLRGKQGKALTLMLPYGKVEIDGNAYDAKSYSGKEIKKGDSVRVVGNDPFCLKVEQI